MRIRSARCQLVHTPAGILLHTSYGAPESERGHVVVEVETEDGMVGRGEATPLPFFTGETAEGIKLHLERHLLPGLEGRDPWDLPGIHARMLAGLAANSSARTAVDMALHDLLARSVGLPLYKCLGWDGTGTLPRSYALGISDPDAAAAQARAWVALGYRTLKIKVGGGVAGDVDRVSAVRRAVGPGVNIRIDANAGYELADARVLLKALEGAGLEMAEQPIRAGDPEAWRALRRSTDIPLAADESLHTAADALALARERLVDFFVVKLIKTGGIYYARQIAAIGWAGGIECIVSTPFDTTLGAAAAVHVAFALGSRSHAHDLPPLNEEIGRTPGRVWPLAGAGIGIDTVPTVEGSWGEEEAGLLNSRD